MTGQAVLQTTARMLFGLEQRACAKIHHARDTTRFSLLRSEYAAVCGIDPRRPDRIVEE
jgi:hypothetical protein